MHIDHLQIPTQTPLINFLLVAISYLDADKYDKATYDGPGSLTPAWAVQPGVKKKNGYCLGLTN